MWAATDIGPGKAPISDFMLISGADQELLALSYNVLRYVNIALILKQYSSIRGKFDGTIVKTWKGIGLRFY